LKNKIIKIFISGLGLGFLPKMPGTWGSLGALGLVYLLKSHFIFYLIVFFSVLILSFILLEQYLKHSNGRGQGRDPQFVVIDEILGILVVFIALPVNVWTLGCGFLLFRIFDITKPMGIRKLEAIHGSAGIIFDDLLAGLYAHISLRALIWIWMIFQ